MPAAPASGGIHAVGVRKRYGSVQALDGVELAVAPGEVLVMIGVNGAGKSTLLRILGTSVLPDAGTVVVAGFDVERSPRDVRRNTGVVLSDERSWYWRLTGRANLVFFARLSGLPKKAAAQRCDDLLHVVQLSDAAERRVDGYSAGMRSRLSLARSLLLDPAVLLLDEPSRALDPAVARNLRTVVTELVHRAGTSVLWVTHDLHEAAELGGRVVLMSAGTIATEVTRPGSAAELERLLGIAP